MLRRAVLITTSLAAVALLAPATSNAALGLSGFSVKPADPSAGAHSDVTISLAFSTPSDNAKSLTLDFPPGLLGNPNPKSTPYCAPSALQADGCPPASVVGSTTVSAIALGLTIPAPGTVYNVTPNADEAARLGIVVRPVGGILGKVILASSVKVRDSGDYGLNASLTDLPTTLNGIPIQIAGLDLTLNGMSGSGQPFVNNPTSCAPATTRVAVGSLSGTTLRSSSTFTPTACGSVPFSPALATTTSDPHTDTAAAIETRVTLPGDAGGRVQSHARRATVTLPEGVGFSPGVGPEVALCPEQNLGMGSDAPDTCPAASAIGTVEFDTPLLGTLKGPVYLSRDATHPFRVFVVATLGSVRVKLIGEVTPDPDTGRMTAVFDNLPQVPFTRFALRFQGGPRAVLTTPPSCGTDPAYAELVPWSGAASATPKAPPLAVSYDGAGNCSVPFRPAIAGTTTTDRAGSSTAATITFTRPDRDQRISRLVSKLPSGLAGKLAGVPMCTGSATTTGDCPETTRVGSVATTVGAAGATPVTLPGTVYLGPSVGGSLASLVIVTPAKVGPIDQGTLVLSAPLTLGDRDGRVAVTASVPAAFRGIPLDVKRLSLTIDRKGFILNPTGCGPRSFDALVASAQGASAATSSPFRASKCSTLAYSPRVRIDGAQKGPIEPGDSPSTAVRLTSSTTGVGLQRVGVVFPKSVQPRVSLLRNVCTQAQLEALACPGASRVGTAEARTPLLPMPLKGNVYLAITGKEFNRQLSGLNLPSAVVILTAPGAGPRGPATLRLDGALRLRRDAARLEGSFDGIPDVPLSSFVLRFRGGDNGVFVVETNPCGKKADPARASLLGQDGRLVRRVVPMAIDGCKKGYKPGPAPDNSAGS